MCQGMVILGMFGVTMMNHRFVCLCAGYLRVLRAGATFGISPGRPRCSGVFFYISFVPILWKEGKDSFWHLHTHNTVFQQNLWLNLNPNHFFILGFSPITSNGGILIRMSSEVTAVEGKEKALTTGIIFCSPLIKFLQHLYSTYLPQVHRDVHGFEKVV
jgi:hypothetical protein